MLLYLYKNNIYKNINNHYLVDDWIRFPTVQSEITPILENQTSGF